MKDPHAFMGHGIPKIKRVSWFKNVIFLFEEVWEKYSHDSDLLFLFLGKFAHQSHSVNTDPCEFHETGKRYTGLAAQGRCQSVQEGRWEQRAQTSDLPGWTERTEKWTSSQNRPDQVCRWMSFTVLFLLKLVSASHSIKEKDS